MPEAGARRGERSTDQLRRHNRRIGLGVALTVLLFLVAVSLIPGHKKPGECEQLWRDNRTTASVPQLADGGHQRYLDACKAGNNFVETLPAGTVR